MSVRAFHAPIPLAMTAAPGMAVPIGAPQSPMDTLEEIADKAKKRQESLQKAPVTVSALSLADLSAQGAVETRALGPDYRIRAAPRTFGVEATYWF